MNKEQKTDQHEKAATNMASAPAASEDTPKPAPVKVRVLKTGVQIDNGIYAAGAIVSIEADKAKALESLGTAVIVGV